MQFRKLSIILFLYVTSVSALLAGGNKYEFQQINISEGLSQSMIFAIMQDRVGYMWFGTANGLNRYDGYEFKVYSSDPKDTTSISDNGITSLFEDRDGYIWVGTVEGNLNRFDRKTGEFRNFDITSREGFLLIQPDDYFEYPIVFSRNNNKTVTSITEDEDGYLWIGTWGMGVIKFNKSSGDAEYFYSDPTDPNSISYNRVTKILIDSQGIIWVGTFGGGLNRLIMMNSEILNIHSTGFYQYRAKQGDPNSIPDDKITSLFEDESGNLWIATFGGGVCVLKKDFMSVRDLGAVFQTVKPSGKRKIQGTEKVMSVLGDETGNIWYGTFGGGLIQYDPVAKSFNRYEKKNGPQGGISDNEIISLYLDRSGLLWIGTHLGNGVGKLEKSSKQFRIIRKTESAEEGLNDNLVWAIHEDKEANLWFGTYRGGINKFDKENGVFQYFTKSNYRNSISDNHIRSIAEDDFGNLWFGTYSGGLNRYDKKRRRFYHLFNDRRKFESLGADQVQSLLVDSDSVLWIGTFGGGLNKIDLRKEKGKITQRSEIIRFTNYPFDSTSLSDNRIYCLYEDTPDILWVGTYGGGLNKFYKSSEKFQRFLYDEKDSASISGNRITAIYRDSEGTLWIGTYGGGVNRFDESSGKFERNSKSNGFPSNVIYGILEDSNSLLWMSSDDGIIQFNPIEENFVQFDLHDGLQSMEFSGGAYAELQSGHFCFGGINGVNIFHPDSVSKNRTSVPVVVSSIKIYDEEIKGETEEVNLDYDQNFIALQFASLDYTNAKDIKYEYLLEGLEDIWLPAESGARVANYANIPPGNYVFRVRGTNSDGIWSEREAALRIVIAPPYWQTWWFITLSIFVLFALISVLPFIRFRQLLAIEKLKTRLAADLHDNIGAGLTEISIMSELAANELSKNDSGSQHLGRISDKARQLVDGMSDIVWVVNPQKDSLHDIILRLKDSYNEFLQEMNISLKTGNISELKKIRLPMDYKQNLYLILKEGINNAIKHSGCKNITVDVSVRKSSLVVCVMDDGAGIDVSEIKFGNGIQNIKDRAKRIGGVVQWISDEKKGTEIKFSGKLQRNFFVNKMLPK